MTDQQKKIVAGSVFGVLAIGVLYFEMAGPGGTPTVAPAPVVTTVSTSGRGVSGGAGVAPRRLGTTAAELDPTLRMGPMLVTESLVYSGTGRNIFSAASVPVALPKPIASARPTAVAAIPVTTGPIGPPPPPPIDLKFFGTATTASGGRQAFLLKGEDVFLASAGDIVQRRYKVVSIAANSILIEDLVNSNRQTLPLLVN